MARLTPAVLRALDILELFLTAGSKLTAADVQAATDLPRTTVHELLTTLASRDYLRKEESGAYTLGVKPLQLGNAYAARFDLLGAANEAARELAQATEQTSSVAVLEQADVFYLAKVEGRDVVPLASSVGKRVPANCTGLGKALLAQLSDDALERLYPSGKLPVLTDNSIAKLADLKKAVAKIREDGYATELEESGPGAACVAAPIWNGAGECVAAISISLPAARFRQQPEAEWAALVVGAANAFGVKLGHRP
ncbi:MAG: IclR family transcriptional regulator [Propionibacteriaceae bacterium]|jgi:DNA-binding IclR family transcriptional regulator|nr:IclR family transcriptional regulator [Propionibacteriaceae bacterium]